MAAYQHINQAQLRGLIATDMWTDDPSGRNYTIDDLDVENVFQDDVERYNDLYQSISEKGIQTPLKVSLSRNLLIDGHHRAIIARELNLDKIPVEDTY